MVFFSTCLSVKFHHELLNYIDLPVMCIHVRLFNLHFLLHLPDQFTYQSIEIYLLWFQGKQKQVKRTATFFQFCQAESGILLCTDVAARG